MLDNFVISNPFCLIFFRSDGTFNYLPSLKKLGVEHVRSHQYECFSIEWAWSKIFEISNFDDGNQNPRTSRYSIPSAKQQPSNIKHDVGVRPNVCKLTFGPPALYILMCPHQTFAKSFVSS